MKTKRTPINTSAELGLYEIFQEMYQNEEQCIAAVRDAKKAFSFVQQDALYRDNYFDATNDEQ